MYPHKEKQSKIQVMDIKFLGSTEGKASMDRTGTATFREVRVQNLLA
jgi:hypothetical protein